MGAYLARRLAATALTLLPALLVVISLVYSATRYDDWPSILHEALRRSTAADARDIPREEVELETVASVTGA